MGRESLGRGTFMNYESTWKLLGRGVGVSPMVVAMMLLQQPVPVAAQGIPLGQQPEFSPVSFAFHSGFRIGGAIATTDGEVSVGDGLAYGGQIEFRTGRSGAFAIMIDYQPTTLDVREGEGPERKVTDLSVVHLQVGGTFETDRSRRPLIGYGTGGIGAGLFKPGDGRDSRWTFAMMMGLGARMPLGEGDRFSLRAEVRLILEPYAVEQGQPLWCGDTGPCYVAGDNTFGPVQTEFSIGISFLK